MPDRDIIADQGGMLFMGNMDHSAILDIGPLADPDPVHITTDDYIEPEARFRADRNIADNLRRAYPKYGLIKLGRLSPIEVEHNFCTFPVSVKRQV